MSKKKTRLEEAQEKEKLERKLRQAKREDEDEPGGLEAVFVWGVLFPMSTVLMYKIVKSTAQYIWKKVYEK